LILTTFVTDEMPYSEIQMENVKVTLKSYLDRCRTIFNEHHSGLSKVVPFPGTPELTKDNMQLFERATKLAEDSEEFGAFVKALSAGPLSVDLERLTQEEQKSREKKPGKLPDLNKYREDTTRQAARSFFRNTGTYLKLWQGSDINESDITNILENYTERADSELIRLFVFDGFVLYHAKKRLNRVRLPVGELRKYTEKELEYLLRLSQSSWHGIADPESVKKAALWHILTVREKTEYRGMSGLWIHNILVSPIDWSEIGEPTRKESDVELFGPIFLCIGENANLAAEIQVRTNVFEYFPVYQKARNGYLPWDSYDDDGNPQPRNYVKYIGEDGKKLLRVFEIWQRVNNLDGERFLRYPTEAYVRSVMNLHSSWESLMETFVGFVTVIESLLTPGTRQDLAYKTAVRGAALLAADSKNRILLFEILGEFYKMRSQIVHEGHPGKEATLEPNNTIVLNLTEISRQIFLRYICLLYFGLEGGLPNWILPDLKELSSKNSRPKAIASILDGVVLDPGLTELLEDKMKQWSVYEDWMQRTTLLLGKKFPPG
jgi:hypothetical protein